MNKTIQSIHILTLLSNLIGKQIDTLVLSKGTNKSSEEILLANAKSLIIIYTLSFLTEWENFLVPQSENDYKRTVIKYKKIAKPAIDRIKKWTGIKSFRNTVLAHNFRNQNNNDEPVFLSESTDNLVIPDHISELYLLMMCTKTATKIISEPFKEELLKSKLFFFQNWGKFEAREIDAEGEMKQILDKINEIYKDNIT